MSIALGIVAFIVFYLYDYKQVVQKGKSLNLLFLVGSICLFVATLLLLYEHRAYVSFKIGQIFTFLLAIVFWLLLLYTLFFALPFEDTYLEQTHSKKKKCYQKGMYALCRHPGVLWLFGFYLMLAMSFSTSKMWLATFVFNAMNLLYVWLQDHYTFPHLFDDYASYQKKTPFVVPNLNSVRECLKMFRKGGNV
ncbi:MAG: hypothetical protein EOM50_02750 [Erysipelotrichia bacterium]|nr:hypothetical protein [Erysipelotrichia bacterium]NCC54004.1 hypothetical protein [Erysipelotrichia bacterium]